MISKKYLDKNKALNCFQINGNIPQKKNNNYHNHYFFLSDFLNIQLPQNLLSYDLF